MPWFEVSGSGEGPPATLEGLWAEYGEQLGRAVSAALGGDDERVWAACYLTMVEAGKRILDGRAPRRLTDWWPWLKHTAAAACRDLEVGRVDVGRTPGGPMVDALPRGLRLAVRRRAMWEWLAWRFRWAVVPLVPETLGRVRGWISRSARGAWRRVGSSVPPPPSGTTNAWGLTVVGSGLPEAAAAAVAVAVLGLGAGPAAVAEWTPDPTPVTDPISVSRVPFTAAAANEPATATGSVAEPAAPEPRPPVRPSPGSDASLEGHDIEADAPVQPEVHSETKGGPEQPIREQPHDNGTEYVSPEAPTTVDVEGDGESELGLQPPIVGVDCPPPEDRGAVMEAACPVLEGGTSDA